MASDENPILEAVRRVLTPLPEPARGQVLALVAHHMQKVPLVSYVCAVGEASDAATHPADAEHPQPWTSPIAYEFRIGQPNPLDQANTVFAMFHWFAQGHVVVFSLNTAQLDTGDALAVYTRDVVFQPRFVSGPLSLDALAADLGYHLEATPWDDVDEPDEPDDAPEEREASGNGGGRRALGARP